MKIGLAVGIFLICIAAALTIQRWQSRPPAHIGLAIDASGSVKRNCAGVMKEAEAAIKKEGVQRGSTLTVLGIGESRANREPTVLFDRAIPIEEDGVFGKEDGAYARERDGFLAAALKACEAERSSSDSPILALVQRSVEHLRSRGCGTRGGSDGCLLLVHSDLAEDVDPRLRRAITRAILKPAAEVPSELVGVIDNSRIAVAFVGTSEVATRRSEKRAGPDTLTRLWSKLFTHPELVSFKPFAGQ